MGDIAESRQTHYVKGELPISGVTKLMLHSKRNISYFACTPRVTFRVKKNNPSKAIMTDVVVEIAAWLKAGAIVPKEYNRATLLVRYVYE